MQLAFHVMAGDLATIVPKRFNELPEAHLISLKTPSVRPHIVPPIEINNNLPAAGDLPGPLARIIFDDPTNSKRQTLNIFVLDHDIERCAQYHCDQHVVKMILESVQILCTALNKMDIKTPYKSTHSKHPCVLWVGQSFDNFLWLKDLTLFLNDEYQYRFDKQTDHRSIEVLHSISGHRYARHGLTPFAQAMPEEYKTPGDAVNAYRRFYIAEKQYFARWSRREKPEWFVEPTAISA